MNRLTVTKTALAAVLISLVCVGNTVAVAQQTSKLLNISSIGLVRGASQTGHIACTVLQGPMIIVVFAESNSGTDLDLLVGVSTLPVEPDNFFVTNDNFLDLTEEQREFIRQRVGRAPSLSTDAALIVAKTNDDLLPVCAVAIARGNGSGRVNLQIQDVTSAAATSAAVATSALSVEPPDWRIAKRLARAFGR